MSTYGKHQIKYYQTHKDELNLKKREKYKDAHGGIVRKYGVGESIDERRLRARNYYHKNKARNREYVNEKSRIRYHKLMENPEYRNKMRTYWRNYRHNHLEERRNSDKKHYLKKKSMSS